MRLLVSGSHFPDFETLKRLALVADEVGFMDHPSVTFPEGWGTIGRDHELRAYRFTDSPITLSVHGVPSGPAPGLYLPYAEADLRSGDFRRAVFEGMRRDGFAWRFIQPKAKHGAENVLGTQLRDDLLSDPTVPERDLERSEIRTVFQGRFGTAEYRLAHFKMIVLSASIAVTSTLAVADETGLFPVSDDPTMCRLLGLRVTDRHYLGDTAPRAAGSLAIAVAAAVIPDEVLRTLTMKDVAEYREKTRDAYAAWSAEINRLALRIADLDPAAVERELPNVLHGEFRPKLLKHRNELKAARDQMFGELIKKVTRWEFPAASLAYVAGLSIPGAMALFAAALAPAVPPIVDYYVKRRELERSHAAGYLVGLVNGNDAIDE